MESVLQVVREHGPVRYGAHGEFVKVIQRQLSRAGFSPGSADGAFGKNTRAAVRLFETANDADKVDGIVDAAMAVLIDHDATTGPAPAPSGQPMTHKPSGFPHDDLASLIAFYGDPRGGASFNLNWLAQSITPVRLPFTLHFERTPMDRIPFHRRAAPQLQQAFEAIWEGYNRDYGAIVADHLDKYSGTGAYRPVRGSATKLSCHAFYAAIDIDAEDLPLGRANPKKGGMPDIAVKAFKDAGFFWGNNFKSRKDPMHFQAAHE